MVGGGNERKALRLTMRRAFVHGHMADAAKGFASGQVSQKMEPALGGLSIQQELRDVASALVELQQARHEADYDLLRTFTRAEVLDMVTQAEQAFQDWKRVKRTPQADAFLVSLLILNLLKGRI